MRSAYHAADLPCRQRGRHGAPLPATADHLSRRGHDRQRAGRSARNALMPGLAADLRNPDRAGRSARGGFRRTDHGRHWTNPPAVRAGLAHTVRAGFSPRSHVSWWQPFEQVSSRGACARPRSARALARAGPRPARRRPRSSPTWSDCEALGRRAGRARRAARRRRVGWPPWSRCSPPTRRWRWRSLRHLHARHGAGWQARVALLSMPTIPNGPSCIGITSDPSAPTYEIGYRAVRIRARPDRRRHRRGARRR